MSFKEEVRKKMFKKLEIGLSDRSIKSLREVQKNPTLNLFAIPEDVDWVGAYRRWDKRIFNLYSRHLADNFTEVTVWNPDWDAK